MMCGYKHTFRVLGAGTRVRGLGVRGDSGHGTMNIGQGVRGLRVRGDSGHGTMNIGTGSHL